MEKNMEAINVGDKVFYKTLHLGILKAIVIDKRIEDAVVCKFQRYTIRITSRNCATFPCGYTFEIGDLHVWKR
jgi:hypothetical protein